MRRNLTPLVRVGDEPPGPSPASRVLCVLIEILSLAVRPRVVDVQAESDSAPLRFLTDHFRPLNQVFDDEPAQGERVTAIARQIVVVTPIDL